MNSKAFAAALVVALLALAGCSTNRPRGVMADGLNDRVSSQSSQALAPPASPAGDLRGMASWYGRGTRHRRTANGERFNRLSLTAAHRTLPFGSLVRVRNLGNGKTVVVRINDRGPFSGRRLIDLSYGAGRALGMLGAGIAQVELEVVRRP
jgi:rare lipoprotein A